MADQVTASSVVIEEKRGWALPPTFAALKHRNYRLYFAGQLISLTGMWMQNTAQPWLVYQMTGSPFYLGVVSFSSSLPPLTLSLWAGVLIDRVPKRVMLVITQSIAMLLAFLLAADVFLGFVQPWHVVIFAILLGINNTFDAPGRQAFVIEMVGREELMNAVALNSATFQIGRIIGPSLAGIFLALVGPAWCFLLNGISFLAVIAALLMMQVEDKVAPQKKESVRAQLREGVGYIWNDQAVRTLFGMVAVANIFAIGYSALLPAFAKDVLDVGPTGLGFMGAAVGAGALVAALTIATLGSSAHKGMILTMGNLLLPVSVLAFAFTRNFPLALVILFFAGLGFMTQNTSANTLIQTSVPDALRGRVMAAYTMIFFGFFPFSALMAGFVAEHWTIPMGAVFGASIALAAGLFWLWRAPYIRKLA